MTFIFVLVGSVFISVIITLILTYKFPPEISEVTENIEVIKRPDKENYPDKPYLVRKLSMVFIFSMTNPMKYPRCMNLCRFKTKRLANKFINKIKKLESYDGGHIMKFDYEKLKTLIEKEGMYE